jgi:hypothetical protein
MAAINKSASRAWRSQIRELLNRDWDPTGDVPADEYDRYVGAIAAMIHNNASDEKLLEYLRWAEAEHMQDGPCTPDGHPPISVSFAAARLFYGRQHSSWSGPDRRP